jgi:hypothetical protein
MITKLDQEINAERVAVTARQSELRLNALGTRP